MKVFISYSSDDDVAVRSLADDLARARQQVWLDHELGGGDAWWPEILAQIRESAVFVFALSDSSLRSKPCQAELDYAEALGLPILPVQIGQVSTYRTHPIFVRQVIDYRDSTRSSGIALVSALHERGRDRADLPDPLPEPPAMPYEYLLRLGSAIRGTAELSPSTQASMVVELREALVADDDANVGADIRELLRALRSRTDVGDSIAREISAMLGDSPGAAPSDRAGHQVAPATHGGWPYDQHTGAGGRPVVAYLHAASGRRYPLNAVATRIGRLSDNDIALDDADVSPHHAVIIDTGTNYSIKTGTNYIINDLRSANGVHVQYQRIRSTATLNDGDHIRIGDQEFTFHIATEA